MSSTTSGSPLALTVLSLLHYRPLHPYGMQQLVRRWGKDQVVNVSQRTSLYRTIERLEREGLVRAVEVSRQDRYPERTVYEVTAAGRIAARSWMRQMLAEPRNEYPVFPSALSNLLLLDRSEMVDALGARSDALQALIRATTTEIRSAKRAGLPRVTWLESEYALAMMRTERRWVDQVVGDLKAGDLTWDEQELQALEKDITAKE